MINKFILSLFAIAIITVGVSYSSIAFASAIILDPVAVSVTKGKSLSVIVSANADMSKAYTVKAEVSYPPALLEVTGFTFTSGWMPLSAPGYDVTDNSIGKIVKTGGFPGGFTGSKTFGTLTFKAKSDGIASVEVMNSSVIYDSQNTNTLSGKQGVSTIIIKPLFAQTTPASDVSVSEPVPKDVKTVSAKPVPSKTVGKPVAVTKEIVATSSITADATETATTTQSATVSDTGIPNVLRWFAVVVAIITLIVGGYVIGKKTYLKK